MTIPTVTCDHCGKSFAIDLKERLVAGGGAEQRFRCPHCRTWYTVAVISAEGVRIRQRMRAVEGDLVLRPDDEALQEELWALRRRMREEVKGANGRVGETIACGGRC